MMGKAFFYEEVSNKFIPQVYVLKSLNSQPKVKEMTNFENDLTNLLKTTKFRVTESSFLQQLKKDIRIMKNTKKS